MKFLLVNTDYDGFLKWLYGREDRLAGKSYEEQMRVRNDSLFGTADFYSTNLKKLGHEAIDIHANNVPLQTAWAKEQGFDPKESVLKKLFCSGGAKKKVLMGILAEQIKYYRPDIILSHDITISGNFWRSTKPYYKLLIGQHASPMSKKCDIKEYDLLLSSLPNLVQYFQREGVKSRLWRLGFEETVLEKLGEVKDEYQVSFIGSVSSAHETRKKWLDKINKKIPVHIWGEGDIRGYQHYHGVAWGKEMFRILKASKIVLNCHIDMAGDYANNMRLFETTGCGSLLMTDSKKNMSDMFEPGKEVVCYNSAEDCSEFIEYYLSHEEERKKIAIAGQSRTLREHTYYNRMEELVFIVKETIDGK
ncbi:MAG TPA: glycosyltransferase [Candidatus Omnitrophota bacterium]|nr:glycosyltransferase [Candidatus Omnitrophota bacterium]HPS19411.1 glycosyltransferase [Candidatus Omnitrophota bacterium]